MSAWGVGGTVRATFTTAAHLASNHDVEIVSVLRGVVEPGMAVPDGLRLRPLFDGTNRRPSPRNLAALLLYRAPSRLWHEQDGAYNRASLWTDVLLLRWMRSLPKGTVVVATRPAFAAAAPAAVLPYSPQQVGRRRDELLAGE